MSLKVDVRKLDLFNKMAKEGSNTIADQLEQLTGVAAEVRTSQINFLDIEDVKTHLGDRTEIGMFVRLTEPPYGYVLFLVDPVEGKRLASTMTGGMDHGGQNDGFSAMERSALQEVGNILTSGFIDGWANVLDATIDMTTPQLVYASTDEIIDDMGGWPESELVFVIDSHVVAEGEDLDVTVYTFPKLHDLVDMIQHIDPDTDVESDTTASRDVIE